MTENVMLRLPVRRVSTSPGWYTYESELFNVKPVKIVRHRCGSGAAAHRYYYQVSCVPPPTVLIEPGSVGFDNGLVTTNLERRLNPKWKPPTEGWNGNVFSVDDHA